MNKGVEESVRKIAKLWCTDRVRIEVNIDGSAWLITARCLSNGNPIKSWCVSNFHLVSNGPSLGEAMAMALKGPPKEGVGRHYLGTISNLGRARFGLPGNEHERGLREAIGGPLACDVGKQVFLVGDVIQVESVEQRDSRLRKAGVLALASHDVRKRGAK